MRLMGLILAAVVSLRATAQWTIQDSHTTAGLRGIDNVGGGVAWASGTNGTVMRTENGGQMWQTCSMPSGAEALDFRGVQAFDESTAIVMSSGKGALSRIYRTTDQCRTWKLIFTNPDKEGFWDAIKFINPRIGFILGDPISRPFNHAKRGASSFTGFALLYTEDGGKHFQYRTSWGNRADPTVQGAFAASNSSLFVGWPGVWFGTGGKAGAKVYLNVFQQHIGYEDDRIELGSGEWRSVNWSAPFAAGEAAGIFSLAFVREQKASQDATNTGTGPVFEAVGVGVGGDYLKPEETQGNAGFTVDGGQHWSIALTPPHGYRSAVAYDAEHRVWITVGPNGTDVSGDDGKNWSPLLPASDDDPGVDRNWNALSLPFVVGPKGRIGRLKAGAISVSSRR